MKYTSLNESQRAQVAYLFADEFFGTSASAFEYEVNKAGDVVGRVIQNAEGGRQKLKSGRRASHVDVRVIAEVKVTDEIANQAQMNFDALASDIARKINLNQTQEVNHESN